MSDAAPPADLGPPRGRRTIWLTALALLLVGIAAYGVVVRDRLDAAAPDTAATPGELIELSQARGTPLMSVGRLVGLPEACTAWLLDIGADGGDPAYAVTAGRCAGIDDTATILVDQPVEGVTVEFRTFAPTASSRGSEPVAVGVEEIAWAATRDEDLAVLRLAASYGDLASAGVVPITLGPRLMDGGQILVAGVPVDGIPDDQRRLRGSRCTAGPVVDVVEAPWVWASVQASDCTGILAGSAGSPALDSAGRVVGMVSTTTIGSESAEECTVGRPCVLGSDGPGVVADTTYLGDLTAVEGCFPGGVLTLGAACGLEDPRGVVVARPQSPTARPGGDVRIIVEDQPAGGAVGVRVGLLGDFECTDPTGWRTRIASGGAITVTLPVIKGFALVCVGRPARATRILVEVDAAAPDFAEVELDQQQVEGGVLVTPVTGSPAVTGFLWVAGPTGSIDCETAEGYVEYRGEPALIEVADLPTTVCVVGLDRAGNATAPVAIEVTLPGE